MVTEFAIYLDLKECEAVMLHLDKASCGGSITKAEKKILNELIQKLKKFIDK